MLHSDYNRASRLLHRLALGLPAIAELSFELEQALHKSTGESSDMPVFVSGLARSGTTILMRCLHETGQFGSLTYADMPFVLMPNTWKMLSGGKVDHTLRERAHKDGIMVGVNSPEALDEVFWRVFCGEDYIHQDRLSIHQVEDEVLLKFRRYIELILKNYQNESSLRYLSKNNNNILRLKDLQSCFPSGRLIITFRDPLQHAISLYKQHLNFCEMHQRDSFSLEYMNWLGHYEFGMNQKPFWLEDDNCFAEIVRYDKGNINFWLASWKNYYGYVNRLDLKGIILVCYETFCSDPNRILGILFGLFGVNASTHCETFGIKNEKVDGVDLELLEECLIIYRGLFQKGIH